MIGHNQSNYNHRHGSQARPIKERQNRVNQVYVPKQPHIQPDKDQYKGKDVIDQNVVRDADVTQDASVQNPNDAVGNDIVDAITAKYHVDIVPDRGNRNFEIPRESDMEMCVNVESVIHKILNDTSKLQRAVQASKNLIQDDDCY